MLGQAARDVRVRPTRARRRSWRQQPRGATRRGVPAPQRALPPRLQQECADARAGRRGCRRGRARGTARAQCLDGVVEGVEEPGSEGHLALREDPE